MFKQLSNPANYYFNPYALPGIPVSILFFAIGLFVLKQNRSSAINIAFFYKCLAMGFWLFSISLVYLSNNLQTAVAWYRYFTFFGVINITPATLFFVTAWSGRLKEKKVFLAVNFAISFAVYILAVTTDKLISPYQMRHYFWGYYPVYSLWLVPYLASFFIQYIISVKGLCLAYKSENIPIKKLQKKMVIIALLLGITASADFLPKFFNFGMYPYGYISMFVYISLVAYAIVKYRAFDIETAIHKTIMWLFSFSFIIIPILLLHKWVSPHIRASGPLQAWFWTASFLLAAFYFRSVQPRIDHIFQRRRANLEAISHRFAEDLVHLKGLAQLIPRIENVISDALYSRQINIFIYDEKASSYRLKTAPRDLKGSGQLSKDEQFLLWLARNNKIAYKEFTDIDPAYAPVKEKAEDYFKEMEAVAVIPLVLNEKLLGLINLGKKSNLKPYSAADFYFLNILKNQSAIAISNSLLYENMEEQVRQRTRELVEVQKQLTHAEKLATVGTLAGGVAHEINNPLTAVLTNVQMLLASDTVKDASDRESLELIEEATKRCRTIVQKLMVYAKKPLESAEVSSVNLLDVLRNVMSFIGFQLEQENIKLSIDAKKDAYQVMGNANELEQVLTNIILNAKDAIRQIKKSGVIKVSFIENPEWIRLEIEDEGKGISQEVIPKIFDPFFTTKDVGKGLGLGLSICHAIIEKHNGMITARSEPGKGSVFIVQLPKAKIKNKVK